MLWLSQVRIYAHPLLGNRCHLGTWACHDLQLHLASQQSPQLAVFFTAASRPELLTNGSYSRIVANAQIFSALPSPPEMVSSVCLRRRGHIPMLQTRLDCRCLLFGTPACLGAVEAGHAFRFCRHLPGWLCLRTSFPAGLLC